MGGHSKGPESEERLMVSTFLSAGGLGLLSRYLNVYYRRTRRLDVPLITALRVAPEPLPDTLKTELEGWTKAAGDLQSGLLNQSFGSTTGLELKANQVVHRISDKRKHQRTSSPS
jgi:hypothetical protein